MEMLDVQSQWIPRNNGFIMVKVMFLMVSHGLIQSIWFFSIFHISMSRRLNGLSCISARAHLVPTPCCVTILAYLDIKGLSFKKETQNMDVRYMNIIYCTKLHIEFIHISSTPSSPLVHFTHSITKQIGAPHSQTNQYQIDMPAFQ